MSEETKISKFNKVSEFFDSKVSPKLGKLATQRHLLAVRNGIVATIPFVIIGSLSLLILNFPLSFDEGGNTLGSVMPGQINTFFLAIYRYTMGAMGLYAAFGIAAYLGRHYGFNQILTGMLGTFAYLIWFDFGTMTIVTLSGSTIFNAMVSGLLAVEIYRFCVRFNVTIKMPKQVPEAISDSFATLVPLVLVGIVFGGSRWILGFDINNFLVIAMAPLQNALTNGFFGVILIVMMIQIFWIFGIHGTSIIGSIVRPFWTVAILANGDWWASDMIGQIPYHYPEPFLQFCINFGGDGVIFGLVLSGLIFSKSRQNKAMSQAAFMPALFNISEPAVFGYPLMLNPTLAIPFLLSPVLSVCSAAAISSIFNIHWVVAAPWTLPAPLGAYFASGGQWIAFFIPVISLAIAFVLYTPFVIKYDKQLQLIESEEEALEQENKKE